MQLCLAQYVKDHTKRYLFRSQPLILTCPRLDRLLCTACLRIIYCMGHVAVTSLILSVAMCYHSILVALDELSRCELADSCHMRVKEVDLEGGDVWLRLSITTK